MRAKKRIPSFKVINWDINTDNIEFFDIMPYLIDCWKAEKKRKHKTWSHSHSIELLKKDDTKMPETFEEFKVFVNDKCFYRFWSRCEYEVIVTGWPIQRREHKLDIYEQVKVNLDNITNIFMSYIKS